jgi:integrase
VGEEIAMASAWVYQDAHQVKQHGQGAAAWYVGWFNPEGKKRCKSCGPGDAGKRRAERLRRKVEAEIMCGVYREQLRTTWESFRKEYEDKVLSRARVETRRVARDAMNHFERIVRPVRLFCIGTQEVDGYVTARLQEPGKRKGQTVSVATVNKELRHLRAALAVAREWGHLPASPKFRMLKEPAKLPTYVTGDHFALIYAACERARMPQGLPYPPADWWRALLVMGYMTGWRIGQMLALDRADLDLDAGTAVTRHADNKGGRDSRVKLHPVVTDHLRRIPAFDRVVFPWNHDRRTLDCEWDRIQQAAGIDLPCHEKHEHTPSCHLYGFHDLRRAFATMNADKLTPDALQALMQHKSYLTTQKYVNMARQMDAAVAGLHVPEVLRGLPPASGPMEG